MQECIEPTGNIVSGGDAPELLEAIERALDQMTSLVAMPVDSVLVLAVAAGPNVSASPCRFDVPDQVVTVTAVVGGHGGGLDTGRPRLG